MKKMIMMLMIAAMIFVAGCGTTSVIASGNYGTNSETKENDYFELQDPDGWEITLKGDIRFVPIAKESIILVYYVYMYTIVDLETGNTYLYTRERVSNGGGTTFTLLTNADGSPCVYKDLEVLRNQYKYKMN